MKKPKLVAAALVLLLGAASAAGGKLSANATDHGGSVMLTVKSSKGRS